MPGDGEAGRKDGRDTAERAELVSMGFEFLRLIEPVRAHAASGDTLADQLSRLPADQAVRASMLADALRLAIGDGWLGGLANSAGCSDEDATETPRREGRRPWWSRWSARRR